MSDQPASSRGQLAPSEGQLQEGGAPSAVALAAASVTVGFVKRNRNRGNLRKREGDAAAGSEGEDDTTVVRKAKQVRGDPLAFSNKRDDIVDHVVTYESNKAIQGGDNSAFRHLETETVVEHDARYDKNGWLLELSLDYSPSCRTLSAARMQECCMMKLRMLVPCISHAFLEQHPSFSACTLVFQCMNLFNKSIFP